jgi:hypothetical protein
LTLVEIDRHGSKVEEFDVEGILNFAERVLPRASDLWMGVRINVAWQPQSVYFGLLSPALPQSTVFHRNRRIRGKRVSRSAIGSASS